MSKRHRAKSAGRPRQRAGTKPSSAWRKAVDPSRLYGRSRWLHSYNLPGEDENEPPPPEAQETERA